VRVFIQTLVDGIMLGGVLSLAAAGFSLIFGVMNVVSLAHGAMVVIGAYLAYTSLTFGVGTAFAGLAGVIIGIVMPFSPNAEGHWTLNAFVVVVLGGVGSPTGAMLGGLLLGLIETFTAQFIGPGLTNAMMFLILVLMLLFRPQGILGPAAFFPFRGAGDQLEYLGRVFGPLEFRPHALYRCRSVCRRKSCPCPWSRLEHIRDTVDLHGIRRNRIRASRTDTGVSPLALAGNLFCHRHAGVG